LQVTGVEDHVGDPLFVCSVPGRFHFRVLQVAYDHEYFLFSKGFDDSQGT